MFEDRSRFVKYTGLRWSGILKSIKKSSNVHQPLFEAFTNSLEAIKLRRRIDSGFAPYINIRLNFRPLLHDDIEIQGISIEDNGIGFDEKNYERLTIFKDDTKGFNNRGSGRIQMIHAFNYVSFDSVYLEGNRTMKRKFLLSKSSLFMRENTILYRIEDPSPADNETVKTIVKMENPLDVKMYADLRCDDIKKALLNHYLLAFCNIKSFLPTINIILSVGGIERDRQQIIADEIPEPTRRDITFTVPMYQISDDMKRIETIKDSDVLINLLPYKINSDILSESGIKITSKEEISETTKIKLTCIDPNASLDNYRYLFLLKSEYFDSLDSDERGNIEIIDKSEFKRRAKAQGYIDGQIILNDIQECVNDKAREVYEEISIQNEQFQNKLEQLKREYLLSEKALADVSFCDSVDSIFKKAYAYDAKIMAKMSAAYEEAIQKLNLLDPSSEVYQNNLSDIVDQMVESLPIQNRTTLSKYVTRRKMVIELMDKILNRMLLCQDESKRNVDEKLLHNLIFKQHSNNPLTSDLWLINEEYMYFKGTSESMLSKVELEGIRIFRDDFKEEEQRYLSSLGENRKRMRMDVLLFPSEGKCVILEFKNPNVNLSNCLEQITKYAYFLRNFTKPEYKFLTFYGYLIGEGLEKRDVRAADGDFKTAPNLDYLFRPMKIIPDQSGGNQDGSLYMEVIQFSVLKQRAELRNRAFIDLLMREDMQSSGEEDNIE